MGLEITLRDSTCHDWSGMTIIITGMLLSILSVTYPIGGQDVVSAVMAVRRAVRAYLGCVVNVH